jgi:hypothetical protein
VIEPAARVEENPPEDSISTLVSQLIDDGKQFAQAELNLYRTRLVSRVGEARNGIILVVAALSLIHAVLVAALVGLVFVLTPLIGPGGATAAVVLLGFALTALLATLGWLQLRKAIGGTDKDDRK